VCSINVLDLRVVYSYVFVCFMLFYNAVSVWVTVGIGVCSCLHECYHGVHALMYVSCLQFNKTQAHAVLYFSALVQILICALLVMLCVCSCIRMFSDISAF